MSYLMRKATDEKDFLGEKKGDGYEDMKKK